MKKKLALVLTLIMVCSTILAACGSNSNLVGTWELYSISAAGQEIKGDDLESFGEATFKFTSDGKVTSNIQGQKSEAEWKEDGDKIIITGSEESNVTITMDGDTLTMEQSGMSMVFKKK